MSVRSTMLGFYLYPMNPPTIARQIGPPVQSQSRSFVTLNLSHIDAFWRIVNSISTYQVSENKTFIAFEQIPQIVPINYKYIKATRHKHLDVPLHHLARLLKEVGLCAYRRLQRTPSLEGWPSTQRKCRISLADMFYAFSIASIRKLLPR
jgi:hypothetical protein